MPYELGFPLFAEITESFFNAKCINRVRMGNLRKNFRGLFIGIRCIDTYKS